MDNNVNKSRILMIGLVVVALGVMIMSGYMILRKPVRLDVSNEKTEVLNNQKFNEENGLEKEAMSRDLWRTLNQQEKLPPQLEKYVSGVNYEGMKIYFSDLVQIYNQLPQKKTNSDENWIEVMIIVKRQLVLVQLAREVGLVDLSQTPVFDYALYQQWRDDLSNKYVMKMWEFEIMADSDISSEQVGEALIGLIPSSDRIKTDEDLTQGMMGMFGNWNVDGSKVKAYVVRLDVAVWLDENYGRLLPSIISSKEGDWSTIIEIPSTPEKVKYVMGQIEKVELDSADLDNYINTVIGQYPDLGI